MESNTISPKNYIYIGGDYHGDFGRGYFVENIDITRVVINGMYYGTIDYDSMLNNQTILFAIKCIYSDMPKLASNTSKIIITGKCKGWKGENMLGVYGYVFAILWSMCLCIALKLVPELRHSVADIIHWN